MPGAVFVPAQLNDLGVDVALTSVAQGDILYRGASKWNNLAPGAAGTFLKSQGAGANPIWDTPAGASLDDAVILAPTTDARNVIQGTADTTRALAVKRFSATHSERLFAGLDELDAELYSFNEKGWLELAAAGVADAGIDYIFSLKDGPSGSNRVIFTHSSSQSRMRLVSPDVSNVCSFDVTDANGKFGVTKALEFNADEGSTGSNLLFRSYTGFILFNAGNAIRFRDSGSATLLEMGQDGDLDLYRQTDTARRQSAMIASTWPVNTDASREGRLSLHALDFAGTREGLRIEASGSAPRIGFLGASAALRQTSGADLTNNVTVGGTNDIIADFTDLSTYANDAATIRNDIYQLARKLKQVNDALRLYGLLT